MWKSIQTIFTKEIKNIWWLKKVLGCLDYHGLAMEKIVIDVKKLM